MVLNYTQMLNFLDLRTGQPKVILGDLDYDSSEPGLYKTEEAIKDLRAFNQDVIKTILKLGYFW